MDVSQVSVWVDDGTSQLHQWQGFATPTVIGGETVQVPMQNTGATAPGAGVLLNASGSTGIVAVDDGGTWAGVTDQTLPFP